MTSQSSLVTPERPGRYSEPVQFESHTKIDGKTGKMEQTRVRPKEGNYMDLRAEMDLLAALSACPDLAVGGKPVNVTIYEP